jgi:DnaJ family protein A protein 2
MNLKIPVEINRFIQEQNQRIQEIETIYVDIPKGIDDGEIIIIREKGNVINNFKGDVKIFIKIENNTEIKRVGLDLIYEKTISLKEALCGFSFELKHLNGKIYTITNSSTVGHVIRQNYQKMIPNMGLERDGHVGNLVIVFNINFPEQLSESVLEELKKIDF